MYISDAVKRTILIRNLSCLPNSPANHQKWAEEFSPKTQAFRSDLVSTHIRNENFYKKMGLLKKISYTICQALIYGGGHCLEFNLVGLFLWLLYAEKNPSQIKEISIKHMEEGDHLFLIIHGNNSQFIYDAWANFYSNSYSAKNVYTHLYHMNALKKVSLDFEERIEPYLPHRPFLDIASKILDAIYLK